MRTKKIEGRVDWGMYQTTSSKLENSFHSFASSPGLNHVNINSLCELHTDQRLLTFQSLPESRCQNHAAEVKSVGLSTNNEFTVVIVILQGSSTNHFLCG